MSITTENNNRTVSIRCGANIKPLPITWLWIVDSFVARWGVGGVPKVMARLAGDLSGPV